MKRPRLEGGAVRYLPRRISLPSLRSAAERCEGCDLYERATQIVFAKALRARD